MRIPPPAAVRAAAAAAALVLLAGCGSGARSAGDGAIAHMSCPQTVMYALGRVIARVYHEGVASERTITARRFIARSLALRAAVERGDAGAAQAAARQLVAAGRMTNLKVVRGGRVLADVGGPALAPMHGAINDARGAAVASYVASVWSDEGFLAESRGIGQGEVALHEHGRSVAGSFPLPARKLPREGELTRGGVRYQYISLPAEAYPAGGLHVFLLRPVTATRALCGASSEDTLVNTMRSVARLIYDGEGGPRTLPQVRRVQRDAALLSAVARGDQAAGRRAIEALLNQHIVRLRVNAGARLLADVGGPYVLAPVAAPLRSGGHRIGDFVLSIQDDEGYLRLTRRLAGLYVLMYAGGPHPQLVKNSLGPAPGAVPASGRYTYRGRSFRVFTLHARAFPAGPLEIRVLVPIPFS